MRKLLVILIWVAGNVSAQDNYLSQLTEMPMMRNPSLPGLLKDCNNQFTAAYRTQWQSVTVPYRTGVANLEMRFNHPLDVPNQEENYWSGGLQAMYDQAGSIAYNNFQLAAAGIYNNRLFENVYLRSGGMLSYQTTRFDPTKATWDSEFSNGEYRPGTNSGSIYFTQKHQWNLSIGVVAHNIVHFQVKDNWQPEWYAGVGVYQAFGKKTGIPDSIKGFTSRFAFTSGLTIPIGYSTTLSALFDYNVQGVNGLLKSVNFNRTDFGVFINYSAKLVAIGGGCLIRWDDAIVPKIKLLFNRYNIGASYDINLSQLKVASSGRGAFEVTLGISFCEIPDGDIPCPRW